ncbi:MAG TPA: AraC family transcriptional regulator [Victivallales bacterium]|nr:AraC family transcriptional regulator [Victivallales bacterium]
MGKISVIEDNLPIIHYMGDLIFDPIWSKNDHKSRRCELLHVISGSDHLVMSRKRILALPGDTLLIPSNTVHRDDFDFRNELKIFMVLFTWNLEKDFFRHVNCVLLTKLSFADKEFLSSLIQKFKNDFSSCDSGKDFKMRIRFLEILIRILYSSEKVKEDAGTSKDRSKNKTEVSGLICEKVKKFLEENYSRPLNLEDIAGHLSISPYHLCHVFGQHNDLTIFEQLTSIRMKKACEMLEEGKLSISEIAYAVGFNNSNYFTKVFHRFYGFPPKKIRRQSQAFKKI